MHTDAITIPPSGKDTEMLATLRHPVPLPLGELRLQLIVQASSHQTDKKDWVETEVFTIDILRVSEKNRSLKSILAGANPWQGSFAIWGPEINWSIYLALKTHHSLLRVKLHWPSRGLQNRQNEFTASTASTASTNQVHLGWVYSVKADEMQKKGIDL